MTTRSNRTAPKVLIVDDDEALRLVARAALESSRFEIEEASNGAEALALLDRCRAQLILLDVVMPGLDGFDTCRALRARPGGLDTPVVMMTSLDDVDSIERAYEVGATDFITKPLNYALLGHRLRYLLRARRTLDELRQTTRRLVDAQRIASLGSWEIDVENGALSISDELFRMFTIDRDRFRGVLSDFLESIHPDDRREVEAQFERSLRERIPLSLEHRLPGNAGERIIHHRAEIERDPSEGRTLLVGTAQDVTGPKRAQQKMAHLSVLSDAVKAVASSLGFEGLVAEIGHQLLSLLGLERVALFDWPNDAEPRRIHEVSRESDSGDVPGHLEAGANAGQRLALLERARSTRRVVEDWTDGRLALAAPMVMRERSVGCLYLEGRRDSLSIDASDVGFLQALAQQLAVAFDRSRLAELERRHEERKRRKLEQELNELREATRGVELVFQSKTMEEMLATIRRVAETDATVLVTGESGTGKELVAQTVHRLSPRRERPFIVVDCAALPPTLIESELFGHEKGAYTGAEQRKLGRFAEADGGTVVLDEIGELPFEVQSKLLRFAQDKQLSPVGGTRVRPVDVRLVAATNRDLAKEVAAGRFREDLFYRLNVIKIEVPSLRHRPEDILLLARHFIESFAARYEREVQLSRRSESALQGYTWPGNVRELRNRVLKAVILSESGWIEPEALGLEEDARDQSRAVRDWIEVASTRRTAPPPSAGASTPTPDPEAVWGSLRESLCAELEENLHHRPVAIPPLGEWLSEDLVVAANDAAGGVLTRAATILGLPEATFRRRYRKAESSIQGHRPRSPSWERVRRVVRDVVRLGDAGGGDRTRLARNILLEEIIRLRPEDVAWGCALLGVTPVTFRRWVSDVCTLETSEQIEPDDPTPLTDSVKVDR